MDYPYNHLYYYALSVVQTAVFNVRDLLSFIGKEAINVRIFLIPHALSHFR